MVVSYDEAWLYASKDLALAGRQVAILYYK